MKILPLFPLELVVFPGEDLNLHIFEPRYKQLVNECDEENKTFGIPAYIEGKVSGIGTEMRLLTIERQYDNGEMDIRTQGIGRFRIRDFFNPQEGKLYAGAIVERLHEDAFAAGLKNPALLRLMSELFRLLEINRPLPKAEEPIESFAYGHLLGLTLEQEYELLEMDGEHRRQKYLINHLTNILPIVQEMKRLQELVQMNGHFRNVVPPQF